MRNQPGFTITAGLRSFVVGLALISGPAASAAAPDVRVPTSTDEARAATRLPQEERLLCVPAAVSTTDEARLLAGASLPDDADRTAETPAPAFASPSTTDEQREAVAARNPAREAPRVPVRLRLSACTPSAVHG